MPAKQLTSRLRHANCVDKRAPFSPTNSQRFPCINAREDPRPCLPRPAVEPPSGPGLVHEIKHDGFRIMALRSEDRVRLFTRNGYDFAARFPKIVAAIESLPVRSCLIDGEAIVVDADGLSAFDLLRHRHHDDAAILCAFDLIELDGEDLKWSTLENRKGLLADVLIGH